jgi:hypothetical protein
VRSGIFPEDEGAVVICKGAAAAADRAFNPPWVFDRVERLVLIDECPLWQASVHVNGRTALEWDDPTGVSRARAMVSHGSWSHASKDWLPPEPERLRSVMQELGLTIKPWKTDSDPLRRWIAEDDARMARATSELGRPVELRLHPRTSPGARAARLFARTPPGCSIRPDGELLATALSRASVVDVGAGGSCVLAALEGVPSVAWSGTERSQIDAAGFSDSDRDTLLAVIAAHSVSMTELRSGEYDLFRTRSSPPTG